eukprot:m.28747 g.28747  ORF g.28747 m.28747 type:complete len:207 (+) comp11877_c0_seq2:20-640(+)
MAGFVQRTRLQLESAAPGFLSTLNHIRLPPIDFEDALNRAKKDLQQLSNGTQDLTTTAAIAKVKAQARVTFSFLTLQLHARGGAAFWAEVDDATLCAFLTFATVELFVDVLTHADPQRQDLDLILTQLTEVSSFHELEQLYERLVTEIKAQRACHPEDWQPQPRHLHAVARAGRGTDWSWLRRGATLAALAIGLVVIYRYVKRQQH